MHLASRALRRPVYGVAAWKWGLALFLLIVGCAGAAWFWLPLGGETDLNSMIDGIARRRDHPLALGMVLAVFVLAGFALVPVTLLIAGTGVAFGPLLGSVYAIAGVVASATAAHAVGRILARSSVQRVAGPRLQRFLSAQARGGVLAVAAVRMIPLAPFTVVNLVFGALGVKLRVFLAGTLLGMVPGILCIVLLVDRLEAAARQPGADTFGWLGAAVLLALGFAGLATRNADRLKAARDGTR
jgi:phospholipase D1/2